MIAISLVLMATLIVCYTLLQVVRAAQLGLDNSEAKPPSLSILGVLGWWITAQLLATTGGLVWLRAVHGSPPMAISNNNDVERGYGLLASPMLTYIVPYGFLLGPILVNHFSSNANDQASESFLDVFHFQMSVCLYGLAALFLGFVVIGLVFIPVLIVFHLLVTLISCWRVSQHKMFTFPLSIDFSKRLRAEEKE